ncbi:MAG: hypothetical protein N2235_02495 [Fischerella sp.]|nr:hypothetical protein [Fischerella sp.]
MLPFQYRRDLNKMINHCRSLQTAMSKELVKCRRHITERYLELEKELEVQVETAEQYAVLARLML